MPRGVSISDTAVIQGRLWTPAVLLPTFWLDAADLSTITIATGVSQWSDKSGKGVNAVQATGANQPAYSETSFFGRPGITFDGINDSMTISTTAMQNLTHGVYWVMARRGVGTTGDTYKPDIGVLPPVAQDVGTLHYIRNVTLQGASYPYYGNPTLGNYDNASSYANNVGYIKAFQLNGTGWGVFRNGTIEGTTAPAAAVPNANNVGYTIARQINPNRFSNNVYAEIIMLQNTDTSKRQLIEGYLAWKWGLQTSLASNHPYINRPPLI